MNQHNTTTTGYLRSLAVGVLLLVSSVPALALVIESRLCDSRQCRGQFSYTTAPPANQTIGGGDLA
ncbi:MAG TPA: hypothetical protein VK642_00945, partial [Burkholderiales bacterium]|nr:hypothetical protein [Burkholderiales bacterium]